MGRFECEKISLLGIILTFLLAISETGESLLPDPNLDDHTFSSASLSSSNLDGATAEARGKNINNDKIILELYALYISSANNVFPAICSCERVFQTCRELGSSSSSLR